MSGVRHFSALPPLVATTAWSGWLAFGHLQGDASEPSRLVLAFAGFACFFGATWLSLWALRRREA